jgi:hypothetical protein
LTHWTLPLPDRPDGVPPQSFGPYDRLDRMPLRDFGLALPERHRRIASFEHYPTLAVLSTRADEPARWLRAGQAMERVLLTATVRGLATTPMTQSLEFPDLRRLLTDTAGGHWAQLVLRLGYAPPAAPSPRRSVTDVLVDRD